MPGKRRKGEREVFSGSEMGAIGGEMEYGLRWEGRRRHGYSLLWVEACSRKRRGFDARRNSYYVLFLLSSYLFGKYRCNEKRMGKKITDSAFNAFEPLGLDEGVVNRICICLSM